MTFKLVNLSEEQIKSKRKDALSNAVINLRHVTKKADEDIKKFWQENPNGPAKLNVPAQ